MRAAISTHAPCPAEMDGRFAEAGIRRIGSTTGVPHPTNAVAPTPLLAGVLLCEINDEVRP